MPVLNRLSSVLNNLARTPTDKAERALDVWDMSNHHSAVIDLLKVNLLATSPKELRDYSPALRNVRHCQTYFAGCERSIARVYSRREPTL